MKTLIATYGLPRSGKSTIAKKLARELGAPVVNRDAVRLALHGQRYLGKAEPYVKIVTKTMVEALFLAGHDKVICDETNWSREAREALKGDWSVKFLPVRTSPEICIDRAYATEQPDLVDVIEQMWNRRDELREDEELYIWGAT